MFARRITALLALAAILGTTPAFTSGPNQNAAGETARVDTSEPQSESVADARSTVAELLGSHGLSEAQVEERLGQLSDEDLLYLAAHADQVQEGGSSPPEYIWILLGVFLVVAIVAAIL